MKADASMFICYKDTNAAIDWLEKVIGFETHARFDDNSGKAQHAELKLDNAVVIIQSDTEDYDVQGVKGRSVGQGFYLCVHENEAIDKIRGAASQAGAKILVEPETTDWGNYHIELLDPQGKQWSIGTYMPGQTSKW